MDVANLEAFVAIVEHGGFTRAASALHLSQPALSRRVALLEARLRQPIFERRRQGVLLTDAGRAFLPHATAALASLRDGTAAVRELEQGHAGEITIAIVGTLASSGVAAQLGAFRDANPGVGVLLRTGTSAEVGRLVRRGDAVLGLRYFADPHADVASRHLYREQLVVIAPPRHRLAGARRIAPPRLRGEPWVAFPSVRGTAPDAFGRALARGLAAAGLDDAAIVPIDSLTAQKRLVEAGFGLALVPASSVVEELARGTLRALDVAWSAGSALDATGSAPTVDVTLIQRRGGFIGVAARRLVEALSREPAAGTAPRVRAVPTARRRRRARASRARAGGRSHRGVR